MKFDTTLLALLSVVGIIAITFIVLYFIKNTCPCTLSKQQVATIKKEFTTNKELNMLIHVNNMLANKLSLIHKKDSNWLNDFYTKNQFEINNVYSNSISKKDFINEDECAVEKLLQNTFKKAVDVVVNNIDKYEKKLKSEREHTPSKKHPDHFKGIIVVIADIALLLYAIPSSNITKTQFTSILATLPLSKGGKNMLDNLNDNKHILTTILKSKDISDSCEEGSGPVKRVGCVLINLYKTEELLRTFLNNNSHVDVNRIDAFKNHVDSLPLPQSCSDVDDSSKNSQYKNAAISLRNNFIKQLLGINL